MSYLAQIPLLLKGSRDCGVMFPAPLVLPLRVREVGFSVRTHRATPPAAARNYSSARAFLHSSFIPPSPTSTHNPTSLSLKSSVLTPRRKEQKSASASSTLLAQYLLSPSAST